MVIHTNCGGYEDNEDRAWQVSIGCNSINWGCVRRANNLLRHRTMHGVYSVGIDELDRGCQGTRVHRMWCKRGTRRKFSTVGWGQGIELVVAPNWLCWITHANLLVEWGRRRGRWIRWYKLLDGCDRHIHLVQFIHPFHQGCSAQRHFMYGRRRWETDGFMNSTPVRETRFVHWSRCSAVRGFADENFWCSDGFLFAPLILWNRPGRAGRCILSRITVHTDGNLRPSDTVPRADDGTDDAGGRTHHGLVMRRR